MSLFPPCLREGNLYKVNYRLLINFLWSEESFATIHKVILWNKLKWTRKYLTEQNIERRQILRTNATAPEQQLWQVLRNNQLGIKLRRQHGIGHYIADFYCPALKLVIEVDGDSHFTQDGQ